MIMDLHQMIYKMICLPHPFLRLGCNIYRKYMKKTSICGWQQLRAKICATAAAVAPCPGRNRSGWALHPSRTGAMGEARIATINLGFLP